MSVLTFTFPHLPPAFQHAAVALFPELDPETASSLRTRLIAAATSTAPDADAERERLNFAFLDARMIASTRHLRTGLHQALLAASRGLASTGVAGGMKTKTVHSEILFALHPGTNIGDSIRKFGISPNTTSLLVLRVLPSTASAEPSSSSILQQMLAVFEPSAAPQAADLVGTGTTEPTQSFTDGTDAQRQAGAEARLDALLAGLTSWPEVEAAYKLGKDGDALFGPASQKAGPGQAAEGGHNTDRRRWAEGVVTSTVAMKPVAA